MKDFNLSLPEEFQHITLVNNEHYYPTGPQHEQQLEKICNSASIEMTYKLPTISYELFLIYFVGHCIWVQPVPLNKLWAVIVRRTPFISEAGLGTPPVKISLVVQITIEVSWGEIRLKKRSSWPIHSSTDSPWSKVLRLATFFASKWKENHRHTFGDQLQCQIVWLGVNVTAPLCCITL